MKTRRFGATGRDVPVVGQGTWHMERDPGASIEALRRGLDLGMTHVDTAEMYGGGRVEEIVGDAIEGRRDEVFLVSKVLPSNASREGTVAACEGSLARLRTDRLDCYLLHWEGSHPLRGTLEAFEELVEAGKILSWGVSNFDAGRLDDTVDTAGALEDAGPPACNQVLYHLEQRAVEHDVLPACQRHGVALVGYSPFGSGRFPRPDSPGGRVLGRIASARAATPRQVALAWLIRHPSTFTIPKSSRIGHVEDNAGAGELELEEDEVRRIDEAFPAGRRSRGLPVI